jgi:hypothetical protein
MIALYYFLIVAGGLTLGGVIGWCMFYVSCQILDLIIDAKAVEYFWKCWESLEEVNEANSPKRSPCD